jgi:hypothetical protein
MKKGEKIIRSVLSVISGYIVFFIAVMILWSAFGYYPMDEFPTTNFLIISIFFEAFFAVGCGFIVAFIAGRKELIHTGILSGIFVVSGILYLFLKLNHYPILVPLSNIFINAPAILFGGYLRKKHMIRKQLVIKS